MSYLRDVSWLDGWVEGPLCSGWLVIWTTREHDAVDYNSYAFGRIVTGLPDKFEGVEIQDDTHRDVAELSVKPSRAVQRRMKKAGKKTIKTTVVICADAKGKPFFRKVGETAYPAYDRLVLAASRKLNVDIDDDRPHCLRWGASWSADN